jgi:VWFA-related protein
MMLNKLNQKHIAGFLFFLFSVFILSPFTDARLLAQQGQEPLTYDVSVSVVLVPVFAVDASGNPVHDLKENELDLFINGERVGFMFHRYEFDAPVETGEKEPGRPAAKKAPQVKREQRVAFIVLDAIFNSKDGFKRAKDITVRMIERQTTDDLYIIMQLTHTQGLDYITGPAPRSKELIQKVKDIPMRRQLWRHNLFTKKRMPDNITFGMEDPREDPLGGGRVGEMRRVNVQMEKMQYMATVKRFGYLLSQFQHALNTITNPKVVFLISEGISRSAFEAGAVPGESGVSGGEDTVQAGWSQNVFDGTFKNSVQYTGHISTFHLQYLKEVAKSINRGGSVLYTINPRRIKGNIDENTSGELASNFMARESGGKYFEGDKVETIVKDIKRHTGAYYELSFAAGAIKGKNMNLKIKCKREGVSIHTLKYAAKSTPYIKMNKVQKKIFALNAVTGGTWSRMSGTVKRIRLHYLKGPKKDVRYIGINVPLEMRNKKADVFLIESDPKTNKVNIRLMAKKLRAREQINVKLDKTGIFRQYIAFIEPSTPFCIFNQVE